MMHATAQPPVRRPAPAGARALLLAGFVALAAVLVFGSYWFFDSYAKDERVDAGPVARFPAHTVTYIPAAHAFLVHESGDTYFALYERSPWLQAVHPTGYEQCHVRWYPVPEGRPIPFVDPGALFSEIDRNAYATSTAPDRGFFLEDCSGWAFAVNGNHLFGGSTALDRYAVQVSGGRVVIDTADKSSSRAGWPATAPAQ